MSMLYLLHWLRMAFRHGGSACCLLAAKHACVANFKCLQEQLVACVDSRSACSQLQLNTIQWLVFNVGGIAVTM